MALKQKIEAGLKRDEYIFDAETASEYVQRNILRRSPGLVLHRCEEYDRERLEIERRIKRAKKGNE